MNLWDSEPRAKERRYLRKGGVITCVKWHRGCSKMRTAKSLFSLVKASPVTCWVEWRKADRNEFRGGRRTESGDR